MPDYKCSLCRKTLTGPKSLARHMQIHTNTRQRLFQCTFCERRFYSRIALTRHTRRYHNHQDDEFTFGVYGAQATTHAQHTESSHGIANTEATVNSSLGTAIVTTVRSATSPVVTTTFTQASGTVTVTHLDLERDYGNKCPICFDSLNDGETITTPCCNAKYHIACLREVDRQSSIGFFCPNCGGVLTRDWLSKTPER